MSKKNSDNQIGVQPDDKLKRMLISYVPLLYPMEVCPGVDYGPELIHVLKHIESIYVHGVLWVTDDGLPIPVLIVDRAKEVFDHLLWWSEKAPCEWFTLILINFTQDKQILDDKYYITLFPNMRKTLVRHNLARNIVGDGLSVSDCDIVSLPLSNSCQGTTYHSIKEKIIEKSSVGFVEYDLAQKSMANGFDGLHRHIKFIENIDVIRLTEEWKPEFLDSGFHINYAPGDATMKKFIQ